MDKPERDVLALALAFAYAEGAWNTANSLANYIDEDMHRDDWQRLAEFVEWACNEARGYLLEIDPNIRQRAFAMMDAGYVKEMDE